MPESSSVMTNRFTAMRGLRWQRRRWLLLTAAGIILAGGVIAWRMSAAPADTKAADARGTLTVSVVPVEKHRMAETLLVTGTLVPWEDLSIGTEAAGLAITQILVDEGDVVTQGQLLAKLDDSVLQAQLQENEAQIARSRAAIGQQDASIAEAQANLVSAQNDLKRAQELIKKSDISIQSTEARAATAGAAQARLQAAEMGKRVAEADLAVASSQKAGLLAKLAQTEIRAPADGIVSKRVARIGRVVIGGGSDELFRIVRQSILELDAEVPDRVLVRCKPGQTARLTAPNGAAVTGTVRAVAPLVDQASRNGIVHIRLPADPALHAGMFVSGELALEETDQNVVPESAVLMLGGRSVVFTLDGDNRVSAKPVVTGLRIGGLVAIPSGVGEGDRVVQSGAGFLKDGDKVEVAKGL